MADEVTHYSWNWDLASSREELWPLVSNTDRFNRDCGYPPVTVVPTGAGTAPSSADTRRLRASHLGFVLEWDERPFEWEINRGFGVDRVFHRGPFKRILARCELAPGISSGTRLTYQVWFTPAHGLGRLALKLGGARWQFHRPFDRVFRHYDRLARAGAVESNLFANPRFSPGGAARLATIKRALLRDAAQPAGLVDRLAEYVATADDLSAQRIRAYALADRWQQGRREVLRACLHATRAGLLDFHWDVLCPHCRGAKAVADTLSQLQPAAYCETCRIDFVADFDQSVELTFTPNPAIRHVPRTDYCIGGPQITPHIVIQQSLPPGESRAVLLNLTAGRYRVRVSTVDKPWLFRIEPGGRGAATIRLAPGKERDEEAVLAPGAEITLVNGMDAAQLVAIEHVAWSDQATTANEVTSLQLFRDLFVREVLRPGGQVSVKSLTIVFTDLKGSTQMYREIGDGAAFSRVLTHFDVLKSAVDAEGGAIVKTMGDAILAVFHRPAPALRAMLVAQRQLALAQSAVPWNGPPGSVELKAPLSLKAGLHYGPCIAINQNDRLDYFGTTVNVAARLCGLCTGADLLLSDTVRRDAEIETLLAGLAGQVRTAVEHTTLRGMADQVFEVHRLRRG
jgi:class 3 adenylate cyclase